MFEIVSYTEFLLSKHECVVIPGFGGFVRQYVGASLNKDTHEFLAPQSWLSFNPDLTHNDGLLVQTIMQTRKITYSQALQLLQKDVSTLKLIISSRGSVYSFGGLGSFSLSMQGVITFDNKTGRYLSATTYAMPLLKLQPIEQIDTMNVVETENESIQQTASNPKETLYISVNRRSLRRVAAVAAAIILMMFVAVPVEDASIQVNKASMLGVSLFETHHSESHPPTLEEDQVQPPQAVDTPQIADTVSSDSKDIQISNPKYYIIISTLPTKEAAEKELATLRKKETKEDIRVICHRSKSRLYVASFDNIQDAQAQLQKVRNNTPFVDAWILKTE